jgi:hypothetical protein
MQGISYVLANCAYLAVARVSQSKRMLAFVYHLLVSQTCLRYSAMTCSIRWQTSEVKLIGLQFTTSDRTPLLVNRKHYGTFPVTWIRSNANCYVQQPRRVRNHGFPAQFENFARNAARPY